MRRRSKASLTDVAHEAGVSLATASRALSQPELLRADTLERVRRAATKIGYRHDRVASTLASGRSSTIGVVIPTLNSPIFSDTLQEMQRALAAADYQLLVASHEYDPAGEFAAAEKLLSHGVDGIVLVGGSRPDATWQLVERSGTPVVQMWCGHPDYACVGVDNFAAGSIVARHLMSLGHRRIGVITGHLRHNDRQRERFRGVCEAMEEAGLTLPAAYHTEQSLSVPGGRIGCSILLELTDRPTALIGTVDFIAIGAIAECNSRGISVPGDISIAGIDDIELSAHVSPSLTTVHIPSRRIGTETVARMLSLIKDERRKEHVLLPIEIVDRHSTAALNR
ncbi:MAG: substrate-binding domain-containing protein [Rhizobiaceae bacterium]|nr:substrate-binding domain-containing protein [Rhizobiaceae bacterium]